MAGNEANLPEMHPLLFQDGVLEETQEIQAYRMEEVHQEVIKDFLFKAVITNDKERIGELLQSNLDLMEFSTVHGGSVMYVAICSGDPEAVASLLRVSYPLEKEKVELGSVQYNLLNSYCNYDGLTPLMVSAREGKLEVLTLLLNFGAIVNTRTAGNLRAIDFVREGDEEIFLALLKADSVLPTTGITNIHNLTVKNGEIRCFFDSRDGIHRLIKEGNNGEIVKDYFVALKTPFYIVNSNGKSAIWQAAQNKNYDVWAYLKSLGAQFVDKEEDKDCETVLSTCDNEFQRALERYYVTVEDDHIMKMVDKTQIIGSTQGINIRETLEGYYRPLDEFHETSILMKVLADDPVCDVVLDFGSTRLECVFTEGETGVSGIADLEVLRIFVGAKTTEENTEFMVLGTLAHEMAHAALKLVYKNHGKPYRDGDEMHKTRFGDILKAVLKNSRLRKLNDIIQKVGKYPKGQREQELIVRVPHILAQYSEGDGETGDGRDILTGQVEDLLKYYREVVMETFEDFIKKSRTSGKATRKTISLYLELLEAVEDGNISVHRTLGNYKEYTQKHNGKHVFIVSNIQLGISHIRTSEPEGPGRILCISLTNFERHRRKVERYLSVRAVNKVILIWDKKNVPELCTGERCRKGHCTAAYIWNQYDYITLMIEDKVNSKEEIVGFKYDWNTLSEQTKSFLLQKTVSFQGEDIALKNLIKSLEPNVEKYANENISPEDISSMIKGTEIEIGREPSSLLNKQKKRIFEKCYIGRKFRGRCLNIPPDHKELQNGDIYIVSNATVDDIRRFNVGEVCVWNSGNSIGCEAGFYVLDGDEDVCSAFGDICNHNKDNNVHLFKYQTDGVEGNPVLLYCKSYGKMERLKQWISTKEVTDLSEDYLVNGLNGEFHNPLLIADEPGTGKSFVINSLAYKLKNKFKNSWICVLDLNYYSQINSSAPLDELSDVSNESKDKVCEFLFKMVRKGASLLEERLFRTFIMNNGKFISLFDSYDEICPTHRDQVIGLLKGIKKFFDVVIVVATRIHEKAFSESKLGTIALELAPMNEVEQRQFLCQYWELSILNLSSEQERESKILTVEKNCRSLLSVRPGEYEKGHIGDHMERVSFQIYPHYEEGIDLDEYYSDEFEGLKESAFHLIKYLKDLHLGSESFMNRPHNLYMVASIVFNKEFTESWLSYSGLFDTFINFKLKDFIVDKERSVQSVSSSKGDILKASGAMKLLDTLSAYVFGVKEKPDIPPTHMDALVAIGMLESLGDLDTPTFTHRTYAEYIFVKRLIRKSKNVNTTLFWLQKLLKDDTLDEVRDFMEDALKRNSVDVSLCKDPLPREELSKSLLFSVHAAILSGYPMILKVITNSFQEEVVKLISIPHHVDDPDLKSDGIPRVNVFQLLQFKVMINFLSVESKHYVNLCKVIYHLVSDEEFHKYMINLNNSTIRIGFPYGRKASKLILPPDMIASCGEEQRIRIKECQKDSKARRNSLLRFFTLCLHFKFIETFGIGGEFGAKYAEMYGFLRNDLARVCGIFTGHEDPHATPSWKEIKPLIEEMLCFSGTTDLDGVEENIYWDGYLMLSRITSSLPDEAMSAVVYIWNDLEEYFTNEFLFVEDSISFFDLTRVLEMKWTLVPLFMKQMKGVLWKFIDSFSMLMSTIGSFDGNFVRLSDLGKIYLWRPLEEILVPLYVKAEDGSILELDGARIIRFSVAVFHHCTELLRHFDWDIFKSLVEPPNQMGYRTDPEFCPTIFHLLLKRGIPVMADVLFRILKDRISWENLSKMLLTEDPQGRTVMHLVIECSENTTVSGELRGFMKSVCASSGEEIDVGGVIPSLVEGRRMRI